MDVLIDHCHGSVRLDIVDQTVANLFQRTHASVIVIPLLLDLHKVLADLRFDLHCGLGRGVLVMHVLDPRLQAQRGKDAEHDHQVVSGEFL